jgi:hypothetical protein
MTLPQKVWCAALVACPVTTLLLAVAFSKSDPRPITTFESIPAQIVEALEYAHIMVSCFATTMAFWVWRRYWWIAWLAILFVLGLNELFTYMAIVSITRQEL